MAHINRVEALAGTELYTTELPCLLHNYNFMSDKILFYAARCYENAEAFYMVFKPFDVNYDFHFNGSEHIRKYIYSKVKPHLYILTREIIATKVHYNVFVWVPKGSFNFHDKHTSKYMINSQYLKTYGDRHNVLEYMIKESKQRRFNKDMDYIIK